MSDLIPEIEKREAENKPWQTNRRELEAELRNLGISKTDLKLDQAENPLILDVKNSPVDRVSGEPDFDY